MSLGVLLLGSLAALLAFFVLRQPQEDPPWQVSRFANQYPVKSEYLKTVKEPILITHGNSYSDGGSCYVEFSDAEGKEYYVCLKNDLSGDRRLTYVSPTPNFGISVPYGGPDEGEFLGILERWAASDPEAKFMIRTLREARQTDDRSYLESLATQQWQTKGSAVSIMNSLRIRNGASKVF